MMWVIEHFVITNSFKQIQTGVQRLIGLINAVAHTHMQIQNKGYHYDNHLVGFGNQKLMSSCQAW